MRNATLRQLKVFDCVARHLSFTRAARELHLTQPAVSAQVKQLEQHAGLPLFEQLGKKVYLTPAGDEMLRHARTIIEQFRDVDNAMQELKGVSGGTLSIAVISAGDYFFPRLLAAFEARHRGVTFQLAVSNRAELLRRMADNRTDLGIMGRPPDDPDVAATPFAPHAYVVVASPDHPLARRKRVLFSDLSREPFLVREEGSDTRISMAQAFGAWLPKLHVAMEIGSNETIKQAVMAGMGLSFLSTHTLALERELGRIAIVDVPGFPLIQSWYVVHRRRKRLLPVAAAFKDFIIAEGARLIDPGVPGRSRDPRATKSAPRVRGKR